MIAAEIPPRSLPAFTQRDSKLAKEFSQIKWDRPLREDLRELLRLAIREDTGQLGDLTSTALVPEDAIGRADVVARGAGVVAGLPGVEMVLELVDSNLRCTRQVEDGRPVQPGEKVARIEGPARSLLTAERLMLNLLGRLSGIATLTKRYVDAVAGTKARVYDTRKTTPGWRLLEKYAVNCGGGRNHRTGLFDAILIKDNHLAVGSGYSHGAGHYTPFEAVVHACRFVESRVGRDGEKMIIEIEVDSLEQLDEVLPAGPDIVLLDNMSPGRLREAVSRRDAVNPEVELEASGGVNLDTIRPIASSGVDRISVGALTHSAVSQDFALDWLSEGPIE